VHFSLIPPLTRLVDFHECCIQATETGVDIACFDFGDRRRDFKKRQQEAKSLISDDANSFQLSLLQKFGNGLVL
jgi:hypothetical protein